MREQRPTNDEQNDYLWNQSGQPDPEIQRLERVLASLRPASLTAPPFPIVDGAAHRSSWWSAVSSVPWVPRFAATALASAALVFSVLLSRPNSTAPLAGADAAWEVETSVAQAANPVPGALMKKSRLRVGGTFETDTDSKASIDVADVGRIDVEPSTRLRLLQSAEGRRHIALDRGTIHAAIWAPPGVFVVDTPSATAVDLGCMYTLQVDESGGGLLRTTLGWVGFRSHGRESFIPAGAAAVMRAESGPGTPYFEDASEGFRAALSEFDTRADATGRHAALQRIVREARFHDALSLWHLLSRVDEADRAMVLDRLSALVPAPAGVTREGILRLDRGMLDVWWNVLDLGDISVWRHWEQAWTRR